MKQCKHEFIGYKDGVRCAICGNCMTHTEFVDYIERKKKSAKKEKDKGGE